jgi:hypothetical protein
LSDLQNHQHCTTRFIELANELNEDGHDVQLVSAALMTASGIYATFSVAGNEGGLNPSGVDKVVNAYRTSLERLQNVKKAEAERRKSEAEQGDQTN